MKRIIQYIFWVLMGAMVSCQQPELLESDDLPQEPEMGTLGKASIVMSAVIPGFDPATKAMGKTPDIHSFHLVVFDEHGMFVELAKAEMIGDSYKTEDLIDTGDNTSDIPERPNMDSDYIRKFRVVLTLTDQPRIIHFIANCPVDQIVYGHESSIIANLYVENGETAYWSRAEVPHIKVEDETFTLDGQVHRHPCEHLKKHLEYVHLLRNFAQIVVEDATEGDPFELVGFSVYNTIDKGTVAPYNNKNYENPFQCFVHWDYDDNGVLTGSGHTHTYQDFMQMEYPYEGHALSSAELNQELPKNGNEVIWYTAQNPFYMYERKVSVMTNEEEKWKESPPHVIVKGLYNGIPSFYKFDLVYNIMDETDPTMISEIKYYNILRNFLYKFTITSVSGPGYDSPEEAVDGTTSNNLAGSSEASKFTEVSIGTGAIAVSYTDTTVVNSGVIHLKYKYERNSVIQNDSPYVTLLNASEGEVVSSNQPAAQNIQSGVWAGYRDVALTINEPTNTTLTQTIVVKTEDAKLLRNVRINLRKRLNMKVSCHPRISYGIDVPQEVTIKLPPGMTEDMFPLNLDIEVRGLTLSPDASVTNNQMPVTSGPSIIDGKTGNSFHFTKTIVTFSEYRNSTNLDADKYRIFKTYWRTNAINNASTIYVDNKYFEQANASWTNVNHEFSNVRVVTQNISKGLDRDVSISFVMDTGDASSTQRNITIKLDGLRNPTAAEGDDESVMTISTARTSGNISVTGNGNAKTVTISGLKTTDLEGKVGFTLDCDAYMLASAESGDRVVNSFNGSFDQNEVAADAGVAVNYSFNVPTYFNGMVINVTLDGLAPANNETRLTLVESAGAIKKYTFAPENAGAYTLGLQTVNKEPSICSVSLKTADEYYYTQETSTLSQAMKEFAGLTVSNVRQGVGRPVSVQFVMANDDADYANKNIRVSLVGMRRSSDGVTAFTVNTGDASAVTRNNRTITLRNIVTSTVADDLSVTIAADDYTPKTTTSTNRQLGQFANVALNPTSVRAEDDQPVTLTFNLSADDYYNGMTVYVDLDGLVPADGSLEPATRATTQYAYSPSQSGQQTIALKTAADGERTCTVKLSAAGFKDSDILSVEQISATYALKMSNETRRNNDYNAQVCYTLAQPMARNATYTFRCKVKATSNISSLTIFLQQSNGNTQKYDQSMSNITTNWTDGTVTIQTDGNDFDMITFNLGHFVGDIYLDDVSLKRDGYNTELMKNNDFETGNSAGWSTKGEGKFEIVPEGYVN